MNVETETFIDSNVIVYLFDKTEPRKQERAKDVVHAAVAEGSACISFQVIQETLNVLVGKMKVSVTVDDAHDFLRDTLIPLWRVMPSEALYTKALDIKERYGYSFYDSLIVAAALDAGCTRLYSEDLQESQEIDGLHIENPFRE